MKKTLITIALAIVAIAVKAQTASLDSGFVHSQSTLSFTDTRTAKDTVPCFFRELTGITKGNLIGVWRKGWVVKNKGYSYMLTIDGDRPYYLYSDKKTKVSNIVIQTYY